MACVPEHVERLDFTLPDFTRLSWVSELARQTWEPRIREIGRAWREIEWLSVIRGERSCSLTLLSPEAFIDTAAHWTNLGLNALPLQIENLPNTPYISTATCREPGQPIAFRLVVGKPEAVLQFKCAWDSSDNEMIGNLLGYPTCCRHFFQRVWIEDKRVDTTWAMAANTCEAQASERMIAVNGSPIANILWRWMGVRAVPHLPCRFDCPDTVRFGERLQDIGRQAGYNREIDWTIEILSWPVEWSALHGIAEVKTPVLRVSTRTDATAKKFMVHYRGPKFPNEGVTGLRFPYERPLRLLIMDSSGFHRGLENTIPATPVTPDWYHQDNGFSSPAGMDAAHIPIVDFAQAELAGLQGNIIDLGCGNGVLLKKICNDSIELIPYGVDLKLDCIAHARQLLPQFEQNFIHADFFDVSAWPAAKYALGILMIGRLLEVSQEKADRLMAVLRSRCDRLLVYIYPGWNNTNSLEAVVQKAGLHLRKTTGKTIGLIAFS
jgi:hypothetical protein